MRAPKSLMAMTLSPSPLISEYSDAMQNNPKLRNGLRAWLSWLDAAAGGVRSNPDALPRVTFRRSLSPPHRPKRAAACSPRSIHRGRPSFHPTSQLPRPIHQLRRACSNTRRATTRSTTAAARPPRCAFRTHTSMDGRRGQRKFAHSISTSTTRFWAWYTIRRRRPNPRLSLDIPRRWRDD